MSRFNTCETKTDGLRNGGFLAHRSPQGAKMRQKSNSTSASSETLVRNIRRATRKHHAAEEKIRIVLDGLRGETSIAELCRREGIAEKHVLLLVEGVLGGRQAPARLRGDWFAKTGWLARSCMPTSSQASSLAGRTHLSLPPRRAPSTRAGCGWETKPERSINAMLAGLVRQLSRRHREDRQLLVRDSFASTGSVPHPPVIATEG
jgi:hypothetical protein